MPRGFGLVLGCGCAIAIAGCGPTETALPVEVVTSTAAATPNQLPQPTETSAVQTVEEKSAKSAPEVIKYDPAPESDETFELEEGFEQLSLDDFIAYLAESDTWTQSGAEIHCTGKPKGYLSTKDEYQNFTWRLDYRFERPSSLSDEAKFQGNTGFLVYITGEDKLWPLSLEVQGKHVQMGAVKENGGAAAVTMRDDDAARQAARLPVGQWNRLEIVSRDGALKVLVNDQQISTSEPNFLSAGRLGIQAENHPFVVRRLRLRRD